MPTEDIQENHTNINGLKIYYKTIGNGDVPIVLLHGWGISSDKYLEMANHLCKLRTAKCGFRIIIPDLPGFGKSEEPGENWNLDDYTDFTDRFMDNVLQKRGFEQIKNILSKFDPRARGSAPEPEAKPLGKRKIVLIGHSFGGRIAIKYAAKHPEKLEKMILTDAAGIKHPLSFKRKILFVAAKIGKGFFALIKETKFPIGNLVSISKNILYKAAREKDYCNASPKMREVMKNVINEDLSSILSQINLPTLLIWGALDRSTPLSDGKLMYEKIRESKLVIVENANHSLPYQKPEEFAKILFDFIKK